MNVSVELKRSVTARWFALVLGMTLCLGLAFIGLRELEHERLDAAANVARGYARATNDLTSGFLHVTLGAREEGPWERVRGLTLLRQALREMESASRSLPEGDQLNLRFRQELEDFQKLLGEADAQGDTLQNEVALHLSLGRLKATAEDVDARLRRNQQMLNERFDRIFDRGIVVALLLLVAMGSFTLRAVRAQRRLDAQLLDSESKFRGVVEQSIAGVAIIHNGTVTYANPRAADIVGCSVEDLVGRPFLDFVVARDREVSAKLLSDLSKDAKAHYTGTLCVRRADGSEILLDLQANPVRINGASAVLGIVQDVSERHRMEAERLAALQMLESLSQSSGDAIFAKDLQGRYTLFNPQAERIAGRSAAEVLGHNDFATYAPDEARRVIALDQSIIRDRKPHRTETTLQTPFGSRTLDVLKGPLYDKNGEVTGIFGVTRDITERKAQELALEESRAELEAVIDALDEGLIVFSIEGDIIRMNPAASRMNGVAFDRSKGLPLAARRNAVIFETTAGVRMPFEDWAAQRMLRGETVRNMECVLVNAERGIRRTLLCSGGLLRSADGKARLGLMTFTDITEQRRAEAALIQAQRLESLGTLAAGIAHDFNNILLAITGNTSLAEAELPPSHPAQGSLAEVQRASQRAKDLVRRILLFARVEESHRRTADLGEVVREAAELMRPTLPARIQLSTTLPVTRVAVEMDPSQIHQVVVNLITNAAHAIEDAGAERRGLVELSLDESTFDTSFQFGLRTLPAGHYARIVVVDNGCGMDETVIARVFDPFFTTKVVGRGTGLGLSIVSGIVTDHGGSLRIQSEPGKGTRIEILLPWSAGQVAGVPVTQQVPGGVGRHVLYVDDESALVSLVTRYLRRQGYEVTGCTDPQEALRIFGEHPERYDLVVTDLSMPQMSGFDVARAAREISATVPIIMMSGYVRPEDRERAAGLGVREVLLKPSTVEDLCRSIDRQLH